jgi:hypothetical protein
MTDETMNTRDLMAAADALTGVRPGMSHHEIRAALERATPTRQFAKYLVMAYRRAAPTASAARGEIIERLQKIAEGDEPEALRGLVMMRAGRVVGLTETPDRHINPPAIRSLKNGDFSRSGPEATTASQGVAEGVYITRALSSTGGRPRKHPSRFAARAAASRAYRRRSATPSLVAGTP